MLPEPTIDFLRRAAEQAGVPYPDRDASLFAAGVLDSFSLVEFVATLESDAGITVPDSDLRPETFETLARIETYLERVRQQP
jgi:acyl carrier protein